MAVKDKETVASVRSTVNYYKEGFDEYWPIFGAGPEEVDTREVEITDMKSLGERPTIHKHGFEVLPFKHQVFDTILETKPDNEVLFGAVGEVVKKKMGATRVLPYQYTMRTATANEHKTSGDAQKSAAAEASSAPKTAKVDDVLHTAKTVTGPIGIVHIDTYYKEVDASLGGAARFGGLSEEETARLLRTRFGVINVWKPLAKPVTRDPLCVCDVRTVDCKRDVVKLSARSQWGDTPTSGLRYHEDHRWYFYDGIDQDQALFLNIFDSQWNKLRPGSAPGVPHTGFVDPRYVHEPARTSMEIRCLVFWEDQPRE